MELPYSLELAGPRTLASSGINQSSSKLLSSDHFRLWIFWGLIIYTTVVPHTMVCRYMTRHCVAVNNRKWERQEDDRFCILLL